MAETNIRYIGLPSDRILSADIDVYDMVAIMSSSQTKWPEMGVVGFRRPPFAESEAEIKAFAWEWFLERRTGANAAGNGLTINYSENTDSMLACGGEVLKDTCLGVVRDGGYGVFAVFDRKVAEDWRRHKSLLQSELDNIEFKTVTLTGATMR